MDPEEQVVDPLYGGYETFHRRISQYKVRNKNELSKLYYPLLTIIYAYLIHYKRVGDASAFVKRRLLHVPPYYRAYLEDMMTLKTKNEVWRHKYGQIVLNHEFSVCMSNSSYKALTEFLSNQIVDLINEHIRFEIYQNKRQRKRFTADATFGAPIGDAMSCYNEARIDLAVSHEEKLFVANSDDSGAEQQIALCKDSNFNVTITSFAANISCGNISADLTMVALGLRNSTIVVLPMKPGGLHNILEPSGKKDHHIFEGHRAAIMDCAFSPKCDLLVSCSLDRFIILWSLEVWVRLRFIGMHKGFPCSIVFAPDGWFFATCAMDRTACVFAIDENTRGPVRALASHLDNVMCVQFHPNSRYLATGSDDRIVLLWELEDSHVKRTLTGHKAPISALAFSKCGKYLASGALDKAIMIWDLSTGQLVATLLEHTEALFQLAFSHDNTVLAAIDVDGVLSFWEFMELTKDYAISNIALGSGGNNGEYYIMEKYRSPPGAVLRMTFEEGSNLHVIARRHT